MIESPLNLRPDVVPLSGAPVEQAHSETWVPETPVTVHAVSLRETVAVVHRAVEAVLTAADQRVQEARSSVDLHLSVGDEPLAVRVELRDREVHATFLTDSAELRTALTHEWQSAAVEVADRPIRFSAPVVAGGHGQSGSFNAAGGETPTGQDQGQRSPERPGYAPVPFLSGRTHAPAADNSRPASAAPRALPTSLHLHTLA